MLRAGQRSQVGVLARHPTMTRTATTIPNWARTINFPHVRRRLSLFLGTRDPNSQSSHVPCRYQLRLARYVAAFIQVILGPSYGAKGGIVEPVRKVANFGEQPGRKLRWSYSPLPPSVVRVGSCGTLTEQCTEHMVAVGRIPILPDKTRADQVPTRAPASSLDSRPCNHSTALARPAHIWHVRAGLQGSINTASLPRWKGRGPL